METSVEGQVLFSGIAQVPLAQEVVLVHPVGVLIQILGERRVLGVQPTRASGQNGHGEADVHAVATRHQSRPARAAGGMNVVVLELDPSIGERVKVGSWNGTV